jgi:hypothetical protein
MVGTDVCEVAALTLMMDRDDTATVDPRTAAKRRAVVARFILMVVRFMETSKRTISQHDFELDEFIAMDERPVMEKIPPRDDLVRTT